MSRMGGLHIAPLTMPPASHVAVYRDALGMVTNQRVLYLPKASDADALETARGRKATSEVFCDVFEICETRAIGALMMARDVET